MRGTTLLSLLFAFCALSCVRGQTETITLQVHLGYRSPNGQDVNDLTTLLSKGDGFSETIKIVSDQKFYWNQTSESHNVYAELEITGQNASTRATDLEASPEVLFGNQDDIEAWTVWDNRTGSEPEIKTVALSDVWYIRFVTNESVSASLEAYQQVFTSWMTPEQQQNSAITVDYKYDLVGSERDVLMLLTIQQLSYPWRDTPISDAIYKLTVNNSWADACKQMGVPIIANASIWRDGAEESSSSTELSVHFTYAKDSTTRDPSVWAPIFAKVPSYFSLPVNVTYSPFTQRRRDYEPTHVKINLKVIGHKIDVELTLDAFRAAIEAQNTGAEEYFNDEREAATQPLPDIFVLHVWPAGTSEPETTQNATTVNFRFYYESALQYNGQSFWTVIAAAELSGSAEIVGALISDFRYGIYEQRRQGMEDPFNKANSGVPNSTFVHLWQGEKEPQQYNGDVIEQSYFVTFDYNTALTQGPLSPEDLLRVLRNFTTDDVTIYSTGQNSSTFVDVDNAIRAYTTSISFEIVGLVTPYGQDYVNDTMERLGREFFNPNLDKWSSVSQGYGLPILTPTHLWKNGSSIVELVNVGLAYRDSSQMISSFDFSLIFRRLVQSSVGVSQYDLSSIDWQAYPKDSLNYYHTCMLTLAVSSTDPLLIDRAVNALVAAGQNRTFEYNGSWNTQNMSNVLPHIRVSGIWRADDTEPEPPSPVPKSANYKLRFLFTTGDENKTVVASEYIALFRDVAGEGVQFEQVAPSVENVTHNPQNPSLRDHDAVVTFSINGTEDWTGLNTVDGSVEILQGYIASNDKWDFFVQQLDLESFTATHIWKAEEPEPFYYPKRYFYAHFMYVSEESAAKATTPLFRQVIQPPVTLTWLQNMMEHAVSYKNNLTLSSFDTVSLFEIGGLPDDVQTALQQLKDAAAHHHGKRYDHNAFDRGNRTDLPEITVHHIWTPEEKQPDDQMKRNTLYVAVQFEFNTTNANFSVNSLLPVFHNISTRDVSSTLTTDLIVTSTEVVKTIEQVTERNGNMSDTYNATVSHFTVKAVLHYTGLAYEEGSETADALHNLMEQYNGETKGERIRIWTGKYELPFFIITSVSAPTESVHFDFVGGVTEQQLRDIIVGTLQIDATQLSIEDFVAASGKRAGGSATAVFGLGSVAKDPTGLKDTFVQAAKDNKFATYAQEHNMPAVSVTPADSTSTTEQPTTQPPTQPTEQPTEQPTTQPQPTNSQDEPHGLRPGQKAGIAFGVIIGVAIIVAGVYLLVRYRKRKASAEYERLMDNPYNKL
ncbi:hypothetical protein PROFUN_08292 [Planoprotostelium fungivorum]|uniref:Uncharacterized protein n=1 Tax=Planoprotostelium fungivorum TaxID=1890364 RepID=A0A2P6NK07_9EUKA|nr:hypothetical protein PROFUN_08292 [Planoprotostelium fungivorum]